MGGGWRWIVARFVNCATDHSGSGYDARTDSRRPGWLIFLKANDEPTLFWTGKKEIPRRMTGNLRNVSATSPGVTAAGEWPNQLARSYLMLQLFYTGFELESFDPYIHPDMSS